MFVNECHQGLLDDHQFVRGVIEQSIEGVPLTSHTDVVVQSGQLLSDDSVGEDPLPLGDDHHIHHHVLGQPDGGPEVPGQGHQEVEDGDDVLGVDGLHAPPGLVSLEAEHSVGDSQDNPGQTQSFIDNIGCCCSNPDWSNIVPATHYYLSTYCSSFYSLQFVLLSFLRLSHLGHC